jgi:hypothetical protein
MITSPAAIDLLTNRKALPVLDLFLRTEHTLSTAAKQLKKAPSSVAYWIPRLLRVGLIEQVDTIERAGLAMPVYRAVAQELRVRFSLLPVDRRIALFDGARLALLRNLFDGVDEVRERHNAYSVSFSARNDLGLTIQSVYDQPDEQRPFTERWFAMKLSAEDAVEFSSRLNALTEEFGSRKGRKTFIGHIGFVAEPKVRWRSVNDQ